MEMKGIFWPNRRITARRCGTKEMKVASILAIMGYVIWKRGRPAVSSLHYAERWRLIIITLMLGVIALLPIIATPVYWMQASEVSSTRISGGNSYPAAGMGFWVRQSHALSK